MEDDRRQREEEEQRRRNDEEAERRRVARLMEDLEDAANGDDQPPASAANDVPKYDQGRRLKFEDDEEDDHGILDDDEDMEDDDIEREGAGYASDPELGTAKRSYNFKDNNNNGSPSGRRERAQSAKRGNVGRSFNEKELRSAKLTTKDYAERSQSRKGKYGVTVPKPFNFDLRE